MTWRVALWMPSRPEWVEAFFACARVGVVAVAVNPRFRSSELSIILERSEAKALIYWPSFKGVDCMSTLSDIPVAAARHILFLIAVRNNDLPRAIPSAVSAAKYISFEDLLTNRSGGKTVDIDPASPCSIFVTSGTTKGPKLALHAHGPMLTHAYDIARCHGFLEPDTVVLAALPLCGQFAFVYLMGGLAAGVPVVITEAFDAEFVASAMLRLGVTHTTGPDDLFYQLLDQVDGNPAFPKFRFAPYGCFNSPPESFIQKMDARGFQCVGCYGSTELQGIIAVQPLGSDAATRIRGGGFISNPDARVRVRNPDTGALLAPGEQGTLEIATPTLTLGYFGDAASTSEAITEDGYFRTGDFGCVREDGSLVFLSRMNDALRLSGFLVNPVEIASHIEMHPAILSCQVVSAHTDSGQRPVAFVIVREGTAFNEDNVREHCARALAKFKVPVRIVAVERYPMIVGANGEKVQRQILKAQAQELVARQW